VASKKAQSTETGQHKVHKTKKYKTKTQAVYIILCFVNSSTIVNGKISPRSNIFYKCISL